MSATTYLSRTAHDALADAQCDLDRHATSSGDGLCLTCRVEGPCARHLDASAIFAGYGLLPRRRPGASRPELTGRSADRFGWFTPTSDGGQ